MVHITRNVALPPGFADEITYLNALLEFASKYSFQWQHTWDGPNFIVNNYWHQHFPAEWCVLDDENIDVKDLIALAHDGAIHVCMECSHGWNGRACQLTSLSSISQDSWPDSLKSYIRDAIALGLPRQPNTTITMAGRSSGNPGIVNNIKDKKSSEIYTLGTVIHNLADAKETRHILDVGSGQGYLDFLLAYEVPAMTI